MKNKYNRAADFLKLIIITSTILFTPLITHADKIVFSEYFTKKRLRIDLYHGGNHSEEFYSFKNFIKETSYGGPEQTIMPFLYGKYIIKIHTSENKLIFRKSYNTLFQEWQNTEMSKHRRRIFEESRFIPFPKNKIIISIHKRVKDSFKEIFATTFDPEKTWYHTDQKKPPEVIIKGSELNSANALDIAVIAEGFTKNEITDFTKKAPILCNYLTKTEPLNKYQNRIKFHYVKAVSQESGTDKPGSNIWKTTAANTRFNSLKSKRYLTTPSYHKLMDLISDIPHEQVIIIVNSDQYGGGGIYNHFSTVSIGHEASPDVLVHEFGHAFGGLGDEYFNSSTSYTKHPALSYEPAEPNLTTLVDFSSKWENMVHDTVPIPTPDTEQYNNITGAFEGGRYLSEGVYRPYRSCKMRSLISEFCPVCKNIITETLNYYTK